MSPSPCTMGSLLPQDPAQPLHPISTTTVIHPNPVSQVFGLKRTARLSHTSKPNKSSRHDDILDTSSFQLEQCHPGDLVHSRQQSGDKRSSFSPILQYKALPQTSRWYWENSTQTVSRFSAPPAGCQPSIIKMPAWVALPGSSTQKLKQAVKLLHSLPKSSVITTVHSYQDQ